MEPALATLLGILLGGGLVGAILQYRATRLKDEPTIELEGDKVETERFVALYTGFAELVERTDAERERVERRLKDTEAAMELIRADANQCQLQLREALDKLEDHRYEIEKLKRVAREGSA